MLVKVNLNDGTDTELSPGGANGANPEDADASALVPRVALVVDIDASKNVPIVAFPPYKQIRLTSHIPAVKEIEVIFAAVLLVKDTADPAAIADLTCSPI